MTYRWSEWKGDEWASQSPYIDWWCTIQPDGFVGELPDRTTKIKDNDIYLSSPPPLEIFGKCCSLDQPRDDAGEGVSNLPPNLSKVYREGQVPIPGFAINRDFSDYVEEHGNWSPKVDDLPTAPADTVIVGVVDTGIGLGNSRFCDENGATRILAAWQQNGARPDDDPQLYLPCGIELYQDGINELLKQYGGGSRGGHLREDEFNRAAGLVDLHHTFGHRELAGRTAHGTHVLDAAAGFAPEQADPEMLRRMKIIAVNLPHRSTVGLSGTFLDYFTLFGIKRIADLSNLIWQKSGHQAPAGGLKGFPIVINLSFGKNAGTKDGLDFFSSAVRQFNKDRLEDGYTPIQLVIPVGNDNLEQGNAVMTADPGVIEEIDWRTLPEDHSSNFAEIWTEPLPNPDGLEAADIRIPIEIAVTAPGQPPAELSIGKHLHHRALGDFAKIYCRVKVSDDNMHYRVCYLLCTAATLRHSKPMVMAPAGRWKIRVRNRESWRMGIYLGVQTDQSTLPYASTGLRAVFERQEYERYDESSGRVLDTYDYPVDHEAGSRDNSPVLRRHGSINATAASKETVAVAGYRVSDGRPADYSATGLGRPIADPGRSVGDMFDRATPSVALPSDDGPAHIGTLAAGAANGSVVPMSGTSFAAAAATRQVALKLLEVGPSPDFDVHGWLEQEARLYDSDAAKRPQAVKVGAGRLPSLSDVIVDRMGPGDGRRSGRTAVSGPGDG